MLPGPPPPRAYKGGRGARALPGQPSPTPPPAQAPALPAPIPPPPRPRPKPGPPVWPRIQGAPCRGSGRTPYSAPGPARGWRGAGVAAVGSVDSADPEALGPRPPPGCRAQLPLSPPLRLCPPRLCIFSSDFVLCGCGCPSGALCPV